jgi:hypothetical protein
MVSVGLSVGMHNGVPYFLLKRRQSVYAPAFSLHVIAVSTICLIWSVVSGALSHESMRLVALVSGIAVAQFFTSARYQTAGRPAESSVAESCLYLLVFGFALASRFNAVPRTIAALSWFLTAYLSAVLIWNIATFPWNTSRLRLWRTYRSAALYGSRMLPATFANVGLVSLGRTLVGVTGSLEQVAVYSVAYRLCAPLVAIHQFLTNFYFKRLYGVSVRGFERYFSALSALLWLATVMVVYFGPGIGSRVIGARQIEIAGRTDLFLLMSIAMVSWAQLSLIELFMNREAKSLIQLPGLAAGSAVTALSVLMPTWRSADQVIQVALFQGLGFIVAILWQFRVSGVARPRWPVARAIVLGQGAILIASWLAVAMKHS